MGHELGHHLHHGDLRAVGREGAGQLQADDAAAHDHHAAGQAGQVQRAGGVDAVLVAGDGDHHGDAAGGDDHIFALIVLAAAGDNAVLFQDGLAADDLSARLFQQELHAAHQLGRDLALALLDLLEAEAAGIAEDVLLHQRADLLHGVGLVHQILGGDAAHVQAGAAQVLFFKQGHLHALLGGGNAQGVAAGAAAYYQYIILFHACYLINTASAQGLPSAFSAPGGTVRRKRRR